MKSNGGSTDSLQRSSISDHGAKLASYLAEISLAGLTRRLMSEDWDDNVPIAPFVVSTRADADPDSVGLGW